MSASPAALIDAAARDRVAAADPADVALLDAMTDLALLDHIEATGDQGDRAARRRQYDTVAFCRTHGALAAAVYRLRHAPEA